MAHSWPKRRLDDSLHAERSRHRCEKVPANDRVQRSSSPDVAVPDSACHAGGRGFESRRSRPRSPRSRGLSCRRSGTQTRASCPSSALDLRQARQDQRTMPGQSPGGPARPVFIRVCGHRVRSRRIPGLGVSRRRPRTRVPSLPHRRPAPTNGSTYPASSDASSRGRSVKTAWSEASSTGSTPRRAAISRCVAGGRMVSSVHRT